MTTLLQFGFSQETFGGGMACTSCAVLAACTYADGLPLNARLVTEIGAKMWQERGNWRSEDAQEIANGDTFFGNTYDFDAWQCSLTGADGRGSVTDLLAKMRRRGPSGVVFTDGTVSFAVGFRTDGKWVIYDSHPPRTREWTCETLVETVAKIQELLLCTSVFDCSIVTRKRPT